MLDEEAKENLRTLTVEVLLAMRAAYLQTPGANALKHWVQIQERSHAAALTCSSPEEWCTKLQRDLRIQSLSSLASDSVVTLVHEVTERSARTVWLNLLEDELGYLMALCRLESERRKEAQQRSTEEAAATRTQRKRGIHHLLDHGEK